MSVVRVSQRRGEMAEARALLRDARMERDVDFQRKALRRVVALMTAGVDTSELFPNMIVACATTDLVSKKLIYLYITTYARKNADLALLSINTLVKECAEGSPIVRGIALRSFAALRVPELLDYLLPVLRKALVDESPYVRKIAVLSTLRVYWLSPTAYAEAGFYDQAMALLRDADAQVCLNALQVLREVSAAKQRSAVAVDLPDFVVTRPVLYQLLNRMSRLNAAQRARVVRLVPDYTVGSEEEMYDLMNLLEEWMQTGHADLLLACCRAFLKLTENYPDVQRQVLERMRDPLLTLMAAMESTSPELAYVLLRHIELLARRAPDLFRDRHTYFYCRDEQPTYLQLTKVDVVVRVADTHTVADILAELAVYAFGRRLAVARRAVDGMGRIAVRLPGAAPLVLQHLLSVLRDGASAARGAALAAMQRHYLRVCRDVAVLRPFFDTLGALHAQANGWSDEASRVALLSVLGEWGEHVADAPYMMEALCEQLPAESVAFRLQALVSAAVLFFKRPPEMQRLLGSILKQLADDPGSADVADRALLYYRLLRESPAEAARVIIAAANARDDGVTEADDALAAAALDRLFEEFDTLSVVYGAPSNATRDVGEDVDETSVAEVLSSASDSESETRRTTADPAPTPPSEDGVALLWSGVTPAPLPEFDAEVELSPETYERLWTAPQAETHTLRVPVCARGGDDLAAALEAALETRRVFTLAVGELETGGVKLYVYAQVHGSDAPLLAEVRVRDGVTEVTIKAAGDGVVAFEQHLRDALSQDL